MAILNFQFGSGKSKTRKAENEARQFILDFIEKLPAGKTEFEVPYHSDDVKDACVKFETTVDLIGQSVYLEDSLQNFIRAIVLHRKTNEYTTLTVVSTGAGASHSYGLSIIMKEDGNFVYEHPEGEREFNNDKYSISMVNSVEELNYLVKKGIDETTEIQYTIALVEKIIKRLPTGMSMLLLADTFDDSGTPQHLKIHIPKRYTDDELRFKIKEFAAKVNAKIEKDNLAVLFLMVHHENKTYALGIGIFDKDHFYIPMEDMRNDFHFAEDVLLLATLEELAALAD